MNAEVRKLVLAKYDGKCAYCGQILSLSRWQVDHIVAKRLGGSDDIGNLNPACKLCNMKKTAFTIDEFRNYIKRRVDIFIKYNSDYRLAGKYNLVPKENNKDVVFFFERGLDE